MYLLFKPACLRYLVMADKANMHRMGKINPGRGDGNDIKLYREGDYDR